MADKDQFLHLMRKRFQEAESAETENRINALDDLRFIHNFRGSQWPEADQQARLTENRPALTNNLLRKFMRSMMGAMKLNRPNIKVRPVDSGNDVFMADLRTDLIRQIERDMEYPASQAYDKAYEGSVGNAFGFMRIVTDFSRSNDFNQKLQIRRVENPFTIHLDPARSTFLGTDGRYAFVNETMDRDEFSRRWPEATPGTDWQTMGEEYEKWFMSDTVRVAEYFYRIPAIKEIVQLDDLSIVELTDKVTPQVLFEAGHQIIKQRKINSTQIMWTKISGNEILETPQPWPGRFIPIVPVFGDEVNIAGDRVLYSFFRDAKDPQMMYNFWLTAATEIVALSPKTPYIGTAQQFKNHEKKWQEANKKNYTYLPYNADPKTKMAPSRQQPSVVPAGHVTMMGVAQQNIMDTQGRYEASLGRQGNERSGKAIRIRQAASDQVTFGYLDSFYQSLELTGYMLVDLMPHVYDTERIVRLRGPDDTNRFAEINTPYYDPETDTVKIANDLSAGEFDVELEAGPSFASRRQEAVDSMIELFQYIPDIGPLVADLVVKNMDFPGAQDIAERIKSASQQGPPAQQ